MSIKLNESGDGMGRVPDLQNGSPVGAQQLAGETVGEVVKGAAVDDSIMQAKRDQSVRNVACLMRAFALNYPIHVPGVVQDGNASIAVAPAVTGIFLTGGEYFWVDAEGCFSVDQLCVHGRIGEREKSDINRWLGYVVKYVLAKREGVAA